MVTYTEWGSTEFLAEYGESNLNIDVIKPNITFSYFGDSKFYYVLEGICRYELILGPIKKEGTLKTNDHIKVPTGFDLKIFNNKNNLILLSIERAYLSS